MITSDLLLLLLLAQYIVVVDGVEPFRFATLGVLV